MSNCISKIGNHVYVNGGADAVKLYKKAFKLDETNGAWLDGDGYIIHQQLERNGELFLSVSEDRHLPYEFSNKCPDGTRSVMLFCVYFQNEDDFNSAFGLLNEGSETVAKPRPEGNDIICDVRDRFGVFWHLRVPKNWNAQFIPR